MPQSSSRVCCAHRIKQTIGKAVEAYMHLRQKYYDNCTATGVECVHSQDDTASTASADVSDDNSDHVRTLGRLCGADVVVAFGNEIVREQTSTAPEATESAAAAGKLHSVQTAHVFAAAVAAAATLSMSVNTSAAAQAATSTGATAAAASSGATAAASTASTGITVAAAAAAAGTDTCDSSMSGKKRARTSSLSSDWSLELAEEKLDAAAASKN
eukprot:16809-Heterococcus_DN1.PRE.3